MPLSIPPIRRLLSGLPPFAPLLAFFLMTPALRAAERVIAEVEKIQSEPGTLTASIGFCLIPLKGEPEDAVGYRIDTGLIPASAMKVISTATANEMLGSDFRFETHLETAGVLDEEGTLTGHLVVRGGGDPTLAESNINATFSQWRAALREAGIRKIEGSVVGDASIFGTQRVADSWQWNDFGNYFGTGACGLTFHQNQYFCTFHTPRVGAAAPLSGTTPPLPDVEFFNEMRVGAAGSGDQGYIYAAPYGNIVYLRGTVPAGSGSFTIRGALPDPALFCARAFSAYLDANGLSVSGKATTLRLMTHAGESLPARTVIHTRQSEPLTTLMRLTNLSSNNLRAECIHRMIGVHARGTGSLADAARATREHWSGKGIDMSGFHMDDGSGLSRANTVTPRQMALILFHAAKGEEFDAFYQSLPVAGRSGTLRNMGKGTAAEGRVVAKSGTIDRVRNYAGYVNARSGERYAFALFVNQYSGSLQDVRSKIVRVWTRMAAL